MKDLLLILLTIPALFAGCHSDNNEIPQEEPQITLYDVNKEAIAYIDHEDDVTIYTFEGEPAPTSNWQSRFTVSTENFQAGISMAYYTTGPVTPQVQNRG